MALSSDRARIEVAASSRLETARVIAIEGVADVELLEPLALEHVNWRVRRAAAVRISNQALLARIAREDASRHVRRVALERLEDQARLLEAALEESDPELSRLASARLSDAAALGRLIVEGARSADRVEAVRRVTDDGVLIELARMDRDPAVRRAAVAGLSEPARLAMLGSEDGFLRAAAVANLPWGLVPDAMLDDADLRVRAAILDLAYADGGADRLRALFANTRCGASRARMVGLIDDAGFAAEVIGTDPAPDVREAAAGLISDQALLAAMLGQESDERVRARLASRVSDQGLLARLTADEQAAVRARAVERLDDAQRALALARADRSASVRASAVSRLNDQAVLADLLAAESDPEVQQALLSRIADPALLRPQARSAVSVPFRLRLVDRLADASVLAESALNDPHWYVRWRLVERIHDRELLARIEADPDPEVSARAAVRLGHGPDTAALLVRLPDPAWYESIAGRMFADREALGTRLTEIVRALAPETGVRVDVDAVMLDTPYTRYDDSSRETDLAVLWIERVEIRAYSRDRELARKRFIGGRTARADDFDDARRDRLGQLVAIRMAEIDVIEFLAELLGALGPEAAAQVPDDPWLAGLDAVLVGR